MSPHFFRLTLDHWAVWLQGFIAKQPRLGLRGNKGDSVMYGFASNDDYGIFTCAEDYEDNERRKTIGLGNRVVETAMDRSEGDDE